MIPVVIPEQKRLIIPEKKNLFYFQQRRDRTERNMINDGLDLSRNAVLCYTPSNRHVGATKRQQLHARRETTLVGGR